MASNLCPKWCIKTRVFVKKLKILYIGPYDLVQISPARGSYTYQIMYGETFNVLQKLIFRSAILYMLPLLMLTLEVLSLSIHYLISIWITCC